MNAFKYYIMKNGNKPALHNKTSLKKNSQLAFYIIHTQKKNVANSEEVSVIIAFIIVISTRYMGYEITEVYTSSKSSEFIYLTVLE